MRKIHRWIGMGLVRLPDASKKRKQKKWSRLRKSQKSLGQREREQRERERVES